MPIYVQKCERWYKEEEIMYVTRVELVLNSFITETIKVIVLKNLISFKTYRAFQKNWYHFIIKQLDQFSFKWPQSFTEFVKTTQNWIFYVFFSDIEMPFKRKEKKYKRFNRILSCFYKNLRSFKWELVKLLIMK